MRKKKINMTVRRYRLVKKCMTQIRYAHQRARADGIPDAVAFVINCKDAVGRQFCSVLNGEADDDDSSFEPPGETSPGPALLRCDGFRFDDAKRAAERFFPPLPAFDFPPPADQILVVVVSGGVETCCIPAAVPSASKEDEAPVTDANHAGATESARGEIASAETAEPVSQRSLLPL